MSNEKVPCKDIYSTIWTKDKLFKIHRRENIHNAPYVPSNAKNNSRRYLSQYLKLITNG